MIGHSVGEVAAAAAAGILDDVNALKTIYARSQHQELTAGHGGMAVVIGSRETTDQILASLPNLAVAACNSPRAFTVSGPKDEIARLSGVARRFKARVRKLDLDYPFHSALMAPVEEPLLESLDDLVCRSGDIAFLSTVTGAALDGSKLDARLLVAQCARPRAVLGGDFHRGRAGRAYLHRGGAEPDPAVAYRRYGRRAGCDDCSAAVAG